MSRMAAWAVANWALSTVVVGGGLLIAIHQGSDAWLLPGLAVFFLAFVLLRGVLSSSLGVVFSYERRTRRAACLADLAGIATVLAVLLCYLLFLGP